MATGDKYRALHARSLSDPEGFWAEQASAIDWTRRWDKVLDAAKPPFYRWFAVSYTHLTLPTILRV